MSMVAAAAEAASSPAAQPEPPFPPCPSSFPSPEICAQLRKYKLEISPATVLGRNLLFCGPVVLRAHSFILRMKIDAYSFVGTNSSVCTSVMGRYCTIGSDVEVGVGNHDISGVTSSNAFQLFSPFAAYTGEMHRLNPRQVKYGEDTGEITIGHDVFIGDGVSIIGNVTIGTGAVIGTGSVINHDVPPYAVVAGKGGGSNSHGIIKHYRFSDEVIADLLESKWWQYDLPQLMALWQKQGKAGQKRKRMLNQGKDFLKLLRHENVDKWPKIEDKWLYLSLDKPQTARLIPADPQIRMEHLFPDEMRNSPAWQ